MSDLIARAQNKAHRAAVSMEIASVASFLEDAFGRRLVAYIANVKDPKAVGQWSRGERAPQGPAAERLRVAFQIFHLLQEKESPHTIRAWFVGLNPQLADESPASALREGTFRDVLIAAKAFLAGG